ncbi:hypothetical protein CEXT_446071 [Caerostris extrusa]|uniref:Uncharacterized protein n=1 Tax=Caerostris extrusa TaxID=172846 RepID=A0AAV4UTP2_CAEEX|nr:hypothetical protein CEXT_446071 [Caerostris extrusa]
MSYLVSIDFIKLIDGFLLCKDSMYSYLLDVQKLYSSPLDSTERFPSQNLPNFAITSVLDGSTVLWWVELPNLGTIGITYNINHNKN